MVSTLNFAIRDGKGAKSTIGIYLPDDQTLVSVQEFVDLFAPIIDDITDGVIDGVSLSVGMVLPAGLAASAGANSDVEEGARFIFASEGGYRTSVRIPTFPETKILAGSRNVSLVDVDVDAFVDAMIDGLLVTAGQAEPSDYRGEDVVSLVSAIESFQRSRR